MVFVTLLAIICIVLRAVLFNQRCEKPWKSLIPFYNKYVLGKLCDSKKLGIITMIFSFLTHFCVVFTYYTELIMLSAIPSGTDFSTAKMSDFVSKDIISIHSASQIILCILSIILIIFKYFCMKCNF